ncbi:hypothetical protein SUNI508_08420 [Seiridium unicorne]|uniref:Uncharacterized protein n=1 Tax=Seiridium unicorne TaxID=138068 RepID=A0ABR2UTT2_9PEZI
MDYSKRLLRKIDDYHKPKPCGAGRLHSNDGTQMEDITVEPSALIRALPIDSLCTLDDGSDAVLVDQEPSGSHLTPNIIGSSFEASVETLIGRASVSEQIHNFSSTNEPDMASARREPRHHPPSPASLGWGWKVEYLRDKWLWEIFSIAFSIACMTAAVIISSNINGTWFSQWAFFLQPSTTISILVTGSQSSMMLVIAEVIAQLKWVQTRLPEAQPVVDFATFDSASRGPLDSLNLFRLWRPRSVAILPLVYMTSLVTISTLAMGPFAQQIINIQVDNVMARGNISSTIPISYQYDYGDVGRGVSLAIDKDGSIDLGQTDTFLVDPDMRGAFYGGYYNLEGPFIDFNCPSSNCSWEPFTSLGMCSSCFDVSNSIIVDEDHPNLVVTPAEFRTPGGWYAVVDGYDKVVAKANYSSAFFPKWNDLDANIVSFVIVQTAGYSVGRQYNVTECSINWCAKDYSNISVNGTLQPHYSVREIPIKPVKGQPLGGLADDTKTPLDLLWFLTTNGSSGTDSSPRTPAHQSEFNISIYDHFALSFFSGRHPDIP